MTLVDMIRFIFANYDPKNDHKPSVASPQPSTSTPQPAAITLSTEITNALDIAPSQPADVAESTVSNRFINRQGVAFQSPEDGNPQGTFVYVFNSS
jgi:hypothetical protein